MTEPKTPAGGKAAKKPQFLWLIYGAALIAGVILIAEAVGFAPLQKITAKLGIALVYSALALLVAGRKPSGIISTILVWVAVLLTFLV